MNKMKVGSFAVLAAILAAAQPLPAWAVERALPVREAVLYVAPDVTSAKLGNVTRGRELVILEKSPGWLHVLASVTPERDVNGWVLNKGIVSTSTPDGDRILFGEAADSEAEASRRHGRRDAADDALRLYSRMAEYFPSSLLAGEALFRAADIKWQIDYEDASTRPSSKERDPGDRPQIDEEGMREVRKKFSNTKWADMAAFRMLDNKLCGDWLAQSKCPEMESQLYEKYVSEHPQSPKAAEALYLAAWRQAALIAIYKTENNAGRSAGARAKAVALAQRLVSQYPQSDWALRAQRLGYLVEQNIPTYGSALE
ncbi:MAG TPA: outer membrane protein assembly factor BamD [Terriglobales bacterium]|nr:outer membrane protein assembly factor BamD [Terriglobales bacterium]